MYWIETNGRRYLYNTRRIGNRVRRIYLGTGPIAEDLMRQQADLRNLLAERAEQTRQFARDVAPLDQQTAQWSQRVRQTTQAHLLAAGFHQHARGEWRQRMAKLPQHSEPNPIILPTTDPLEQLCAAARSGDPLALQRLREWLDAHPEQWQQLDDLYTLTVNAWTRLVSGGEPLLETCLQRQFAEQERQLRTDHDTPLERLLMQNILLHWSQLVWASYRLCRTMEQGVKPRAEPASQKRFDQAQKRFQAATKQLVIVRKLLSRVSVPPTTASASTAGAG